MAPPTHSIACLFVRGRCVVPASLLREINAGILSHLCLHLSSPRYLYAWWIFLSYASVFLSFVCLMSPIVSSVFCFVSFNVAVAPLLHTYTHSYFLFHICYLLLTNEPRSDMKRAVAVLLLDKCRNRVVLDTVGGSQFVQGLMNDADPFIA